MGCVSLSSMMMSVKMLPEPRGEILSVGRRGAVWWWYLIIGVSVVGCMGLGSGFGDVGLGPEWYLIRGGIDRLGMAISIAMYE